MDFAKKLMEKYGWKEGEGLGKNNTGINKALKANLKFDSAGLGCDQAAEFNNHWWERVFNEAANNIDINTNGDTISMNVKDKNGLEITTKEYSTKKLKKYKGDNNTYNNFLKTATLTNLGNEETDPNRINIQNIEMTEFKPLTDEELFAACGGRTAHKGARHGLKLSGKLSRIEEQEKLLLAKMQDNLESNEWTVVKSKKKNKNKNISSIETPEDSEKLLNEIIYNSEYHVKSKKKRNRQKELENNLSNCLDSISMETSNEKLKIFGLNENSKSIKKDKKKKREKSSNSDEWSNYRNPEDKLDELEILDEEQNNEEVKIKKKPNTDNDNDNSTLQSNGKIKKKKKTDSKKYAKKLKKTLENITDSLDSAMGIACDN